MAAQDFAAIQANGLLGDAEEIVVEAHRRLYEVEGLEWSRPIAYHWLHYEDPDPLARLMDGAARIRERGGAFDPDAVDKACARAVKTGFPN